MADPLSLVSAIVGLTAVGTKLFNQLYQFIDSFRSAPRSIVTLARELEELCSILTRLETTLNNGVRHEVLWLGLRDVLESCVKRFSQLEALVNVYGIRSGDGRVARQWKKWRWTFQEKEVSALRIQLEAHKATLNITLLLSTHTETATVKDTADRIESAVQAVLQRLGEMQDGKNSIASYASSIGRYLHESASSFVSLPLANQSEEDVSFEPNARLLPGEQGHPEPLEERNQLEGQNLPLEGFDEVSEEIQTSNELIQQPIGMIHIQSEESRSPQEEDQRTLVDSVSSRVRTPVHEEEKIQLPNEGKEAPVKEAIRPAEGEDVKRTIEEKESENHSRLPDKAEGQSETKEEDQIPEAKEHSQSRITENRPPINECENIGVLEVEIKTVSVAVLSLDNNYVDGDEDGRIQLQPSNISNTDQPQIELVKLLINDARLLEWGMQLPEGRIDTPKDGQGESLIEKPIHTLYDGIYSRLQLQDEVAESQANERAGYLRAETQQLERECAFLGEEAKVEPGIERGLEEGGGKDVGEIARVCDRDEGFASDSTATLVEEEEEGQIDKLMQLKAKLQQSYEQTAVQIKEEEVAKSKKASIEKTKWEKVQKDLVNKWKKSRAAAEKEKKSSFEEEIGDQGKPRNVYTIYCKTGSDRFADEGWYTHILPKAYNCREALLEEQKSGYTERTRDFAVHRILTQKEQEYLWARATQKQHLDYTKHTKDTTYQAPIVQSRFGEYFKYTHIAGQDCPITIPITAETIPGGGMRPRPRINTIQRNDLFPPDSQVSKSSCSQRATPGQFTGLR